MSKGRFFGIAVAGVVAVIVLGVTTHATAGPVPHQGFDCLACALCEFISGVVH
jgi:hypothetical protein